MVRGTVISEAWREQNRRYHAQRADWGGQGAKWARGVAALAREVAASDILDYGAGKGGLAAAVSWPVRCYEPAFGDPPPDPADLVVCTHVLEHVEPACLGGVLADLRRVAGKALFVTLGTGASGKIMPDGRDSNLIQQDVAWWEERLRDHFPHLRHLDRYAFQRGRIRDSGRGKAYLTAIASA